MMGRNHLPIVDPSLEELCPIPEELVQEAIIIEIK